MEKVVKIWLTDSEIWIQTENGKIANEKFADYPRLKYATPEQRMNYTADDFGVHWADLEEDLSMRDSSRRRTIVCSTGCLWSTLNSMLLQ